MAIATGSRTFEFNVKVSNHSEIISLMSHVVKSDDAAVKRGKPHPEIFQVASSRFKAPPLAPENVLVFEDAPNGVQAARAAGMNVVMVPEIYVDKALCRNANQVLTSLENFDPTVWGLPPFT
jgi:pseudouridine-5'-monophosphatase